MTTRKVVLLIFAVALGDGLLLWTDLIQVSDAISLLLATALVGATLGLWQSTERYVKATSEIAKATKEQAEVTRKLAEEAEKQRFEATKPIVVFRAQTPAGEITDGIRFFNEGPASVWLQVTILNIGNGPALDVSVTKLGTIAPLGRGEHLRRNLPLDEDERIQNHELMLQANYKDASDNAMRTQQTLKLTKPKEYEITKTTIGYVSKGAEKA